MPPEKEATTVREAVGVFATPETLQEAIDELMSSGFDRADLSLLASEDAVEAKLGHVSQGQRTGGRCARPKGSLRLHGIGW